MKAPPSVDNALGRTQTDEGTEPPPLSAADALDAKSDEAALSAAAGAFRRAAPADKVIAERMFEYARHRLQISRDRAKRWTGE